MNIKATPGVVILTLELNTKEAMIIKAIFGNIAGNPEGPCGITTQIYDKLEEAGVRDAILLQEHTIVLPATWDDVVPEDE